MRLFLNVVPSEGKPTPYYVGHVTDSEDQVVKVLFDMCREFFDDYYSEDPDALYDLFMAFIEAKGIRTYHRLQEELESVTLQLCPDPENLAMKSLVSVH